MANWTSSTQTSSWDADQYINKADSARVHTITSGVKGGLSGGQTFSLFKGIEGYNVVGINANKISSDVIPAFETYIRGINDKIGQINATSTKMRQAFRGTELEKAIANYVAKMEQFLKNFTTQLRAFEDKLVDVKKAWDKSQQNQAQSVTSTSSAFANLNEYTRKLQ